MIFGNESGISLWPLTIASKILGWSEPKLTKQFLTPASTRASKKANDVVYLVLDVSGQCHISLWDARRAYMVCSALKTRLVCVCLSKQDVGLQYDFTVIYAKYQLIQIVAVFALFPTCGLSREWPEEESTCDGYYPCALGSQAGSKSANGQGISALNW